MPIAEASVSPLGPDVPQVDDPSIRAFAEAIRAAMGDIYRAVAIIAEHAVSAEEITESGAITAHNLLTSLDYDNAGHTGFARTADLTAVQDSLNGHTGSPVHKRRGYYFFWGGSGYTASTLRVGDALSGTLSGPPMVRAGSITGLAISMGGSFVTAGGTLTFFPRLNGVSGSGPEISFAASGSAVHRRATYAPGTYPFTAGATEAQVLSVGYSRGTFTGTGGIISCSVELTFDS